eukprot:COSAG01_NODE_7865_length_3019_cov_6.573288_2_plen_156_part_00
MEPGTVGGFEVAGTRSLSPDIVAKGVLTIDFLLPSWMLLWVFARQNLQNLEGCISTTLCLTVRLTLRPVVCADMVTSLEKPLANFLQRRHMILYESEQDRMVSVQAILTCFLCCSIIHLRFVFTSLHHSRPTGQHAAPQGVKIVAPQTADVDQLF